MNALDSAARERAALSFIERFMFENGGIAPSVQEIAAELGVAKSTTWRTLSRLEEQGRLRRRSPYAPRSLELSGLPSAVIALSDEALLAECVRRRLIGHTE